MDKTKKQQDIEDYNHASKGVNNGRNHGFATPEHLKPPHEKSDQRDADIDIAYSILIEQEAQRRAEFERRMHELSERYAALDKASLRALEQAEEELREIQENANRAKDGRRIYMSEEDGEIYDEEGNIVDQEDVDWSQWDERGSTLQKYDRAVERFHAERKYRDKVLSLKQKLSEVDDAESEKSARDDFDELRAAAPPGTRSSLSKITSQSDVHAMNEQKGSLLSTYKKTQNLGLKQISGQESMW